MHAKVYVHAYYVDVYAHVYTHVFRGHFFSGFFPFRAKVTLISPKHAQLERTRSIGKWLWCVSAIVRSFPANPADVRSQKFPNHAKSRFPLIL